MSAMSFQAMAQAIRELIVHAGPAMALAAIIILTWAVSRFVAKYQEQQRILKYLPDVIRKELERRDAELKEMRAHVAELEAQCAERVTALRAVSVMAGKVHEIAAAAGAVPRNRQIRGPAR